MAPTQESQQSRGVILHRLGFTKLSARPRHPRSDSRAQELYKNFAALARAALPEAAKGKPLEIWFQE